MTGEGSHLMGDPKASVPGDGEQVKFSVKEHETRHDLRTDLQQAEAAVWGPAPVRGGAGIEEQPAVLPSAPGPVTVTEEYGVSAFDRPGGH